MPESLKNKIFWFIFILLIILSVIFTFVRVYIWKDYQVVAETSCDPKIEQACFARESEVGPTAENGLIATTTETTYYKIIDKKAASISACEKTEDKIGCGEELTCTDGEVSCTYQYCTEENVPEEESCTD